MIVVFKSKASGDVIMFGDVADNMMRAIGKEPTPQGIVTVEQLKLRRDDDCPICGKAPTISAYIDYEGFCAVPSHA